MPIFLIFLNVLRSPLCMRKGQICPVSGHICPLIHYCTTIIAAIEYAFWPFPSVTTQRY